MKVGILTKLKGYVSGKILEGIASILASDDADADEKIKKIFQLLSALSLTKFHKESFKEIAKMADTGHPFFLLWKRVFKELSPKAREKLIWNLLVNAMTLGRVIRDKKEEELGIHLPFFMVISPTMRCNLRCKGCYAGDYDTSNDLTFEEIDRILTEAKELGMYFFTISGGEVFTRKDIFDIWAKHDDAYFNVYTNGTLITKEVAKRLAELGNVAPMISIEGSKETTDRRRGAGIHEKALQAMDNLREAGVLFGFSATLTSASADSLTRDEFIDEMIERGCKVGWFFQYIPTGENPDLSYMATPEQRAKLHEKVEYWRSTRPIFLGDFWNDGRYVDGCMAGGERYLHIIANGDVEPCVFVHFAVDNIRNKSLVEVLKSPFFQAIREAQPYCDDNLLAPCLIIDKPHLLRDIVKRYGAHPTHPGADKLLNELAAGLDEYSRKMHEIYKKRWEEYERWLYVRSILFKEDKEYYRKRMEKRWREMGLDPEEIYRKAQEWSSKLEDWRGKAATGAEGD